jgi:excisionase family DNA binding protein
MQVFTVSPEEIREIIRQELQAALSATKNTDDDTYLSQREVAALLQVSKPTVIQWGKTGKLRPYKLGGKKVFYKKSELFNH